MSVGIARTPVSDVSKLLGHTSLTTTSRYLMNMQRAAMRRAVDRLERATGQSAKPGDVETMTARSESTDTVHRVRPS
jgi:hypothetical protein